MSVRNYIEEQINQHSKTLDKVNQVIEIYLEGYIQGYKYENLYSLNQDKLASISKEEAKGVIDSFNKKKNIFRNFKEQSIEILKDNIDVYMEDLEALLDIYKDMIILNEECLDSNLREEAIKELREKFNL